MRSPQASSDRVDWPLRSSGLSAWPKSVFQMVAVMSKFFFFRALERKGIDWSFL